MDSLHVTVQPPDALSGKSFVSTILLDEVAAFDNRNHSVASLLSYFSLCEAVILNEYVSYPFGNTDAISQSPLLTEFLNRGLLQVPTNRELSNLKGSARAGLSDFAAQHHLKADDIEQIVDRADHRTRRIDIWDRASGYFEIERPQEIARSIEQLRLNNDDAWFLRIEYQGTLLARHLMAGSLGGELICSPFEQPFLEDALESAPRRLDLQLYEHLSDALRERVGALVASRAPIPMFIPPIPAIILDQSLGTVDTIVTSLVELRGQFAQFRRAFRDYRARIEHPDGLTLGELMDTRRDALEEIDAALLTVSRKRSDSRLWKDTLTGSVSVSDDGPDKKLFTVTTGVSLAALAKAGIEHIATERVKARARTLFDLWSKVLQLRDYHRLTEAKLGFAPTTAQVDAVGRYARNIDAFLAVRRDATRP